MAVTASHGVTVEAVTGDIVKQGDLDAVVNAANAQLGPGGGVAGAIHRAAGPGLEQECRPYAPIEPGEAVVTTGHNLPNPYVVHCLGPRYKIDEPSDKLLAACYRNALAKADAYELAGIGFPALSTGAFGYPMGEAVKVCAQALAESVPKLAHVKRVRFVLPNQQACDQHEQAFAQHIG